ncbi:MAG: transglycosylase SLT domain-containing protein, partial [Deltaproteobacteria bacterium]|nr:transglycosylase SLT domain-containing protein [Deltaproteobacteria bacterium]
MKRNILMFFFCAALLSPFSAAQADSGPLLANNEPAIQGSLPAAGIKGAGISPACPPVAGTLAPEDAGETDAQGAACGEEEGPGEAALLYYEDAARFEPGICVEDAGQAPAPFESPFDEAALTADTTEENLCLDNGAEVAAVEDSIPGIPIVVNKNVESFIKYFQGNGRKYFEKWWDRSQHYMVMIREILQENGMPEDLSYIAFIESGLNPKARSKSNAVGMWQFIKGTGVKYGLRVDWWIDERMDPEKATHAAARYFKDLYGRFGSWYLAAAGYNAGEGRVMSAVRKHGSEDFWELASHKKPFKRETKDYVPKYLAALMIAKDPVSYGFEEIEYREGPMYEKVKVSQATDLRVIARAAGTTVEE